MRSETLKRPPEIWLRVSLFWTGIVILALVYIFQRANVGAMLGSFSSNAVFALKRIVRLILNDFACMLIIYAVFWQKRYLQIAFWVFVIELVVILPVYLVIKLSVEGDSEISSPLLSQVHRLIVNPTLMLLLIAGFFYQRYRAK